MSCTLTLEQGSFAARKLSGVPRKASRYTSAASRGWLDESPRSFRVLWHHRRLLRDASATPTPTVSPEVASARSIGLKLTPNQAQVPRGIIGRTIESLTNHAKLERALSRPNAATVTRLAGREIGVNGPVTRASVQAAKAAPDAVYAQVARLGNVPVDDAFRQQIACISNPGAGSFAFDTPADIARLKEGYGALQNFDAGDAVAKVRQLRRDAGANVGARYNPGQQALGHAQKAVADAIENQLERHVAATGGPSDLLSRYRDARTQLAKINTVSQALNAGKGQSVSALNLAKQFDRGAPLSGNLLTIAEAAQHFPRALQDLHKIRDAGPLSALDLKLEGGLGVLKPLAALKAAPLILGPRWCGVPWDRISTSGPRSDRMHRHCPRPPWR